MARKRWKLEVALTKNADRWVITVRVTFIR
jgi:hypothetical protein